MDTNLAQNAASASTDDASVPCLPHFARYLVLLREQMPELRRRFHVRSLGLFGSYVRGEEGETSDLDVLVEFDAAPTFFGFIELEDKLSSLLGVKVDLVMKSRTSASNRTADPRCSGARLNGDIARRSIFYVTFSNTPRRQRDSLPGSRRPKRFRKMTERSWPLSGPWK